MSSAAILAQGTTLHIAGTAGGAKTITGATPGFPTIITATGHGLANGDVVTIASVTGTMAATVNVANLVISNVTANTFAVELNTVGLTYTSGGTATPLSWIKVGNMKSIKPSGASSDDLDVTDLDSTTKESRGGLVDPGTISLEGFTLDSDVGQAAMLAAFNAQTSKSFKVTYPSGPTPVRTFTAFVKKFPDIADVGVNGLLTGSIELRRTGAVTVS